MDLSQIDGRFQSPFHRLWRIFSAWPANRTGAARTFRQTKIRRLPLWIGLMTAIVISLGAWALAGMALVRLIRLL
jgi:hypothetical protein